MGYYRKWQPSKTQARKFAQKMDEIQDFCIENNITQSRSSDSYYFSIENQKYRVSNHTQLSNLYYQSIDDVKDTIFITASKTRIIEIYNDLKAGYKLDKRGRRIENN